MLPDLARPSVATLVKNRMIELTIEGKNPHDDPLFRAADKIAKGGNVRELTPEERRAWDGHLKGGNRD